ncbi:MAG: 4-hydroxy-tetrahydrodipicolinate synthase [Fimbriimonadaceae bacterium]|nr:4-hydroxy-tetrahydrodipicolinate synthase [Chitinophagales bacterium]
MHTYSKEITNKFKGTGVALVTPFNTDGSIDYKGLENVINHVINGGVEYVVSMGTTGESVTLSEEEKFSVIDFTVKTVNKRIPVVAGFGGNNTNEIIQQINRLSRMAASGNNGVDAILSNSPYYNKPSQEGIYQHYMAIDKISPLPIILYNVPGRTSSNMEAETTLRIAADSKNIIGIKEASGNFMQCMKIIRDADENFLVISGDDPITLPFIATGMVGVISVVANAFPKQFSEMVRSCLKGDFISAKKSHLDLLEFTELIFKEGSPPGVKCALKQLGICGDNVRLPLWSISDALADKISAAIKNIC